MKRSAGVFLFILSGLCTKAQEDTIALKGTEVSAPLPEQLYQGVRPDNPRVLSATDNLNLISGAAAFEGASNTAKFSHRGFGSRSQYTTSRSLFYLGELPVTDAQGYSTFEDISPVWFSQPYMPEKTRDLFPSALGGVLVFEPVTAQHNALENDLSVGSFGLVRNTISLYTSTQGYKGVFGYEYATRDGWRENSRLERQSVFYHDQWRLSKTYRLSALLLAIRNFSQIPSSIDLLAFESDPSQAAESWARISGYERYDKLHAGLTLEHSIMDKTRWATTLFYRWRDGFEPRPFNILRERSNAAGLRTVWERKVAIGSREARITGFAEMATEQHNARTHVNLFDSADQSYNHPGALINATAVQSHRLNAGAGYSTSLARFSQRQRSLMCELALSAYYQYNVLTNGARERYDVPLILAPYLALRYTSQRSTSYMEPVIRIYRSYAIPSVEENLDPNGQLNTGLKPELAWTGEFSILGRAPERRWPYSITMYYTQVRNLIIPKVTGPDQVVATNSGTSIHTGIEMSFNPSWTFGKFTVQPSAGGYFGYFAYQSFRDTIGTYDGNRLPGFPDKQLNANLQVWYGNTLFAGATGRFTEGYAIDDSNTVFTDPYVLWQCWAGAQFDAGRHWNFSIRAGVKNIGDERYAAMTVVNNQGFGNALPRYYYPGEPRNWFASLKIAYRWNI